MADDHLHAGLRQSGIIAPLVRHDPMTGAALRAYISNRRPRRRFSPAMCSRWNRTTHKKPGVEAAITSLLYLPAYSPDPNPIEQFFAQLKALLRKAAARSKEVLWATAGQLLDLVSPTECQNYLSNAGYEPT